MARRDAPRQAAATAMAARITGTGTACRAPRPTAATTAAAVVAHSRTLECSTRSSTQKATEPTVPSTSTMVDQPAPAWTATAALTTGIRKAPRW